MRERSHTAQKMMNNLSSQRRFEQQRDLLLVKVGEAKTRLLQGKTKMHFMASREIAASIPELENLEERLKNVLIWDELNGLLIEVRRAIGMIK